MPGDPLPNILQNPRDVTVTEISSPVNFIPIIVRCLTSSLILIKTATYWEFLKGKA